MNNFKTQIIICAVLLISIHEYVFGEPQGMSDLQKCNEEVSELCDGTITAAACKSTIFLNKLYIHYIEENYSKGYINYLQESTSMDGVLYIEFYCQLFSEYDDCITQINEHFNAQDFSEQNQREDAFDHAIKNMTFSELLRTNPVYAKGYFTHLEDYGKLRDGTLSSNSWCDMLECKKELNILCNGSTTPTECKTEIFNNKLYSSYREGSYSRRYFDHIGETISLDNIMKIEVFCKRYAGRMVRSQSYCVEEILTKFHLSFKDYEQEQIENSFNYAFRQLTLDNFTGDIGYAEMYFQYMNVDSLVGENTIDLNQWCLTNC